MYSLTVQLKDSSNPQQVKSATFNLAVNPAPALTLRPAAPALPSATVNNEYNQAMTAGGGIPHYSFTITNNALPGTLTIMPGNGPGSGATGPGIELGTITVGPDGSLTGALDFRNQTTFSGNQSISGAAGSCKDGAVANTGTLSITAGGTARTLNFSISTNFATGAIGHVAEKDSPGFTGAGQMQIQESPTTSLEGSRAFGVVGFTSSVEAFAIGAVCLNAQSSISFLQADFAVNGTEFNMIGGAANPGAFSAPEWLRPYQTSCCPRTFPMEVARPIAS